MTPEDLARALGLTRPLVFLDIETTTPVDGADPDAKQDRAVELAVMKIYPDGKVTAFATLVNPGMPIAKSCTYGDGGRFKGHGITDDDVKDAPPFKQIGRIVAAGLNDSDLAGYNVRRYDFKLFICECQRNAINYTGDGVKIVDQFLLWASMEPRGLEQFIERVTGEKHDGHRAALDVAGAVTAMLKMFDTWPELPRTVDALSDICWTQNPVNIHPAGKIQWRGSVPTMCFGKYDTWDMRRVPSDYWDFIVRKDFDPQMKRLAREAMAGVYPVRDLLPFDAPAAAEAVTEPARDEPTTPSFSF